VSNFAKKKVKEVDSKLNKQWIMYINLIFRKKPYFYYIFYTKNIFKIILKKNIRIAWLSTIRVL